MTDLPAVRAWEESTTAKQREVRADAAIAALTKQVEEAQFMAKGWHKQFRHEAEKLEQAEYRCKELEAHERQTHDQLGAILGTGDSMQSLATDLVAENAALRGEVERLRGENMRVNRSEQAKDDEVAALRGEVERMAWMLTQLEEAEPQLFDSLAARYAEAKPAPTRSQVRRIAEQEADDEHA